MTKSIIKELFIRCRKLNICIVFITPSYFRTPKDVRLNSTHYLLMKIQNKKELQHIAQENSGDIDFKDFLNIYNIVRVNFILLCLLILHYLVAILRDLKRIFQNTLIKRAKIDQQ